MNTKEKLFDKEFKFVENNLIFTLKEIVLNVKTVKEKQVVIGKIISWYTGWGAKGR